MCNYNDKKYQKWKYYRTYIMKTCPQPLVQRKYEFYKIVKVSIFT